MNPQSALVAVWEAIAAYLIAARDSGHGEYEASVEIASALMDAATRINIHKGLDVETFVSISRKHYEATKKLMRAEAARSGN